MKTRSIAIVFIVLACVFYLSAATTTAKQSEPYSRTVATLSSIEASIKHALIWHLFWDEGKTRSQIIHLQPSQYWVCTSPQEERTVYLDKYLTKLVMTEIEGDYYGFDVVDFKLQAQNPAEAKKLFADSKSDARTKVLGQGMLHLYPADLSILEFVKPNTEDYRAVTNKVADAVANAQWLRKLTSANPRKKPITLLIGGFNPKSPWVYYAVHGQPYVGMILLNPATKDVLHDDFFYIQDNYRGIWYTNIKRAVETNGVSVKLTPPPNIPIQK